MPAMKEPMKMDAKISACGCYRWWLSRVWDEDGPLACWIMLNPSTADASQDDPTIRRCIDFSRRWGMGGLYVVNIFALRATDPKVMLAADDPVGPECEMHLLSWARSAQHVVAAWGAHGKHRDRGRQVTYWLRQWGIDVHCLGTTKAGQPKHPLYIRADTPLRPYSPESH